jgi:hypothetical protein
MVSTNRAHRRGVTIGLVAVLAASALAAMFGLGAAAGDTAVGLQTPYFDPPALSNPSTPGFTINSGADQPDPFMMQQGGRYYLFTSQDQVPQNVPVRSGTSVGQWGAPTDALPDPPAWAQPGVMWAPDVAQLGNHFLLYFTSQLKGVSPSTMCIGDAISTSVAGPYIASPVPFICQQSLGGSIDPRVFDDANGQPYMVWKSDQNARSNTVNTQIYSQPLSVDGVHLLGQPTAILGPDESWQGHIVEAPQLVLVRGSYFLFYSGGWFNQPGYSIGAARCAGPLGPCSDHSSTPLLGSNSQGQGPRARNRSMPTRRASGSSTRPSAPTCRCPGPPARSPWPIWASECPGPTWPPRSTSPALADPRPAELRRRGRRRGLGRNAAHDVGLDAHGDAGAEWSSDNGNGLPDVGAEWDRRAELDVAVGDDAVGRDLCRAADENPADRARRLGHQHRADRWVRRRRLRQRAHDGG